MLDALDMGVVLADADGVAVEANAAASRIMGVAHDVIIGSRVSDWTSFHEDGRPWDPDANPTTMALRTGEVQHETVIGAVAPGGSRRWVAVQAVPVGVDPDGRPGGVVTSFSDITVRWEADLLLQRALDRLERSFGTSLIGMAVIDARGRFIDVNDAFCRLVGRREGDLGVRRIQEVSTSTSWAAVSVDGAAVPDPVTEVEFTYVRPDGTEVDTITSITPLATVGSDELQFFVSAQDLTERKRLERRLLEAQKLEAVGQLAAGVAHDFNNLLMVVMGHLDAARIDGGLPVSSSRSLDLALVAIQRGTQVIDSLLSFSRNQFLESAPVQVNDLVSADVAMLSQLIGGDIELVMRLDPKAGVVLVDRGRLSQVLVNLVLNSRDAMPLGGRLTIETARQGSDLVDGVVIEVDDTGSGMTSEVCARAFDPFFTTKPPGRGTGLGLSTAYGIVSQSGGTITVETEPGKGTTFRIWLPAAPQADAGGRPGAPGVLPVPGLVLVAEDDPELRRFVVSTLRRRGQQVGEARDGHHALELAGSLPESPALLVTDVRMPVMGGVQVARELRGRWPDLPVLFMTGHADPAPGEVDGRIGSDGPVGLDGPVALGGVDGLVELERSGGGGTVLRKPFDAAALVLAVEARLAGR